MSGELITTRPRVARSGPHMSTSPAIALERRKKSRIEDVLVASRAVIARPFAQLLALDRASSRDAAKTPPLPIKEGFPPRSRWSNQRSDNWPEPDEPAMLDSQDGGIDYGETFDFGGRGRSNGRR